MSPPLPSPVPGRLAADFPAGDAAQKAPGSPSAPSGCCINRACNYRAPLRTPSRPPGLCFVLNSGTPGSAGSPPAALPQPLPSRTGSTGGPQTRCRRRLPLLANGEPSWAPRSPADKGMLGSARFGSAWLGPAPPPLPVPPRGAHRARGAGGTPPPGPAPAPGPVPALPGTRSTETASSAPVLVVTATPEAPPDGRRGRCLPPLAPGRTGSPGPEPSGCARGRPGREGQGPRNGLGRSSRV